MRKSLLLIVLTFFLGCETEVNAEESVSLQGSEPVEVPVITGAEELKAVQRHNEIRNEVFSNANLVWSVDVAESAQAYADVLANSGAFEHDSENLGTYGENLYTASFQVDYVDAINAWYSEKPYYNYSSNSCQSGEVCGHYTQIVWKDSTEVGCGIAQYTTGSRQGHLVISCRYNPPGNYVGNRPY